MSLVELSKSFGHSHSRELSARVDPKNPKLSRAFCSNSLNEININ